MSPSSQLDNTLPWLWRTQALRMLSCKYIEEIICRRLNFVPHCLGCGVLKRLERHYLTISPFNFTGKYERTQRENEVDHCSICTTNDITTTTTFAPASCPFDRERELGLAQAHPGNCIHSQRGARRYCGRGDRERRLGRWRRW